MLGLDAMSRGDVSLRDAVKSAIEERRIWIRTGISAPSLQYGIRYFLVEPEDLKDQLAALSEKYPIREAAEPFSRCLKCNCILTALLRTEAKDSVPEKIYKTFLDFHRCPVCGRVYWPGSHLERMREKLNAWGWENP
jgi:uncharacterized protein with PIN domain